MSKEIRNASIRDGASRLLLEIAEDLRQQAKAAQDWAKGANASADMLERMAGGTRRIRAMNRIASRVVEGQTRASVPVAIRRELERAAADLEKRAARIKATPVTATERTLKQVAIRKRGDA